MTIDLLNPQVQSTGNTAAAQKQARLVDGAQQFEAMLIGEMLKPMQFGEAPGADESTGGANDTLRGIGIEAMAKGIAKGGGFGLSRQIIRQVNAEHKQNDTKQSGTKV